jgi:ribosomal protein L37AE/L43A
MSERAVPFHCPYCGDESLRPHGATHGTWECRACLRAFSLKYLGIIAASRSSSGQAAETGKPVETQEGDRR